MLQVVSFSFLSVMSNLNEDLTRLLNSTILTLPSYLNDTFARFSPGHFSHFDIFCKKVTTLVFRDILLTLYEDLMRGGITLHRRFVMSRNAMQNFTIMLCLGGIYTYSFKRNKELGPVLKIF